MTERIGKLYGIGAGPGDPEWITLRGHRLLKSVPVVAYPKSRMDRPSFALSIVETYLDPERQELLGLFFPMTRDEEKRQREWNEVVRQLWQRLAQGQDVAFVTEGDPLLYSTFIHLQNLLLEKHSEAVVEVVPGISSVNGTAARLGLPLADADQHFGVIPATQDGEQMKQALLSHDCVVFIKVAKVLDRLLDLLEELGLTEKAAVVSKVSTAEEVIYRDVRALKGQDLPYFSLMVVKK